MLRPHAAHVPLSAHRQRVPTAGGHRLLQPARTGCAQQPPAAALRRPVISWLVARYRSGGDAQLGGIADSSRAACASVANGGGLEGDARTADRWRRH